MFRFFQFLPRALSAEMVCSNCLQASLWIRKLNLYLSKNISINSKIRNFPRLSINYVILNIYVLIIKTSAPFFSSSNFVKLPAFYACCIMKNGYLQWIPTVWTPVINSYRVDFPKQVIQNSLVSQYCCILNIHMLYIMWLAFVWLTYKSYLKNIFSIFLNTTKASIVQHIHKYLMTLSNSFYQRRKWHTAWNSENP